MSAQTLTEKKPLQFKTASDELAYIGSLMDKFADLAEGPEAEQVWAKIRQYMFAEDIL